MYVKKNFTLRGVLAFSWFHIVWISAWSLIGPSLFYFIDPELLDIPWLPISIVATAVAFYIESKTIVHTTVCGKLAKSGEQS